MISGIHHVPLIILVVIAGTDKERPGCSKIKKIAVVAAMPMIHGILFSLYGNCHDKIRALLKSLMPGMALRTVGWMTTVSYVHFIDVDI
jgi:hypothetical protein